MRAMRRCSPWPPWNETPSAPGHDHIERIRRIPFLEQDRAARQVDALEPGLELETRQDQARPRAGVEIRQVVNQAFNGHRSKKASEGSSDALAGLRRGDKLTFGLAAYTDFRRRPAAPPGTAQFRDLSTRAFS